MNIREIEAKSILRKHRRVDSWFVSCYGMNLYRGCSHACAYCDGRSETYNTKGDFGQDIDVKVNAIEVLRRELDPRRKRVPLKRSYIMLGGGVGDSYQPVEKKYLLTRRVLELIREYDFPVHVLTKSTLVTRDVDIIKEIDRQSRAIVSMSFSTADDTLAAIFEPGVPSPTERLETLRYFKNEGIACGMFLLPVIPFITDTTESIENTVKKASETGVDFIIFGGMTLKDGRQKDHFMAVLKEHRPELILKYQAIYLGNRWGQATAGYYDSLNRTFYRAARKYRVPVRMPRAFFADILSENDLVAVLLEHIDYLLGMEGERTPFGYAAHSISRLEQPLSSMMGELRVLRGVGEATERLIREILKTGTSSYYERLSAPYRKS
ncbi:MAG TPA: radical SAM protein [Dehalococcoidia bacterium]|nr:radical SAM protein [Dehalococcoidia bacterium]